MRTFTVYSIRQLSTDRRYVGMSCQIRTRWQSHRSAARCGVRHPLYDAMRDAGEDDFRLSLIGVDLDEHTARIREREITVANQAYYPAGFSLPHAGLGFPPIYPNRGSKLWRTA